MIKSKTKQSSKLKGGFDQHWHLSTTPTEISLTELEFSLFRSFEAFSRWQSECLATVTGEPMSGTDNAILHLVRMRRRPKSIKEIAMLLNRDDMPNLQYAVRKLLNKDLISKEGDRNQRKSARYAITAKGLQVTDDFADIRRTVLIDFSKHLQEDLNSAARTLELMAGIYDQAARIAATHRSSPEDDDYPDAS
jgi:predicted MarR family transcription regulator